MKIHRIKGIILRHLYQIKHDTGSLIAPFYWPLIEVLLWGLASVYIQSFSQSTVKIVIAVVSGAVLWLLVYRSFYDFTVSIIYERWEKNLINLFASPLQASEWVVGVLIFGMVRVAASFIFITFIALALYHVQILKFGIYLVPFIFILMLSGWWIGFFVAGFNLIHGRKADVFIWTVTALISPFSAIYYRSRYFRNGRKTSHIFCRNRMSLKVCAMS